MSQTSGFVSLALCVVFPAFPALGQIWTGLGPDNNWSTADNWNPVAVPLNDGTATLIFGATERTSPNLDAAWNVNTITFNNQASPFALTGATLTLQGGITNADTDLMTLQNNINLGAAQTWTAQFGDLRFDGSIAQGANDLILAGPNDFLFTASRSGSGQLILRDNATATMLSAVSASGGTVISQANSGAVLEFNASNQLSAGQVTINRSGILRLLDQGGATVTLANEFAWNGDRFGNAVSPVIDVRGADDLLVLTNDINQTDRGGVVKEGQGTLRYVPSALTSDSRWSLGIREGAVEMNQLPYRSGQNTNAGQATGDLDFLGDSTLRMLFDPAVAASIPSLTGNFGRYGYGFANLRVADGVTATIAVESGAVFKMTGRTDTNNRMLGNDSTLILNGADLTALFQFGVGNSGGTINELPTNRTIELRGGTLSFFGVAKTFWPQTLDFTMKLNGGEYDGRLQTNLQSLPGNLVINDNPSASDPHVRAWIINDTGGANASYGNIQWNGTLVKVGDPSDTLTFNRNTSGPGTAGYVALAPGAALDVQGGTVTVAGGLDPFTDSFDPARHVNIALGGGTTLNANRNIGIGTLTGTGTLTTSTAGTKTILLESASSSSFSGTMANGSGQLNLVKQGSGTQTFTTAQTYSGFTTINSGQIILANNGTLLNTSAIQVNLGNLILDNTTTNLANRLGDTIAISLGSGTGTGSFQFLGNASAASTETVGVVTANTGSGSILITPGAGQTATLTLSGVGQISGGTLDFQAGAGTLGGGAATDPTILITGQGPGLIGGWATVGNSFAEYTLANGVRAFAATDFNYDSTIATLRNIDVNATQTLTNNDAELTVRYVAAVDTDFNGFTVNIHNGGLIKADATTTTISNGTLTAGNAAASDLTVNVTNGGTLNIAAIIANNSIPGVVTLVKTGEGILNLQANNTFTGGLYLNQGTVAITADNQLGANSSDLFFYGGTLRTSNDITLNAGRTITLADGLSGTFQVSNTLTSGTSGQLVSGQNSLLIKTGTGTLRVNSANDNFDGSVRINQGAVEIRNVSSLGDAADRADIFLNGGQFRTRFNGDQTPGHNLIVSANSSLNVRRASAAGGTGFTHTFGDLSIGSNTLTISANNNYIAAVGNVNLTGDATFNNSAGFIVNEAITGNHGFTKSGAGTMTLTGTAPNTYTGTVNVTGGTLVLNKAADTPTITGTLNIGTIGTGTRTVRLEASNQIANAAAVSIGNGGVLNLNNFNETIGSLASTAASSQVQLGSGTLTTGSNNTSTTFGGVISGTGGLTKQGTGIFTLSGINTYTGATTIEKGTLRLGAAERIDDASIVSVAATATFDLNNFNETIGGLSGAGSVTMGTGNLTFANTTNQAFSGIISGTGGITMAGSATQTLSGENTFIGPVNIDSGTLMMGAPDVFNNSVSMSLNGGTFATGGFSDTLDTLTLTADSTINFGDGSSVLRFSDSSALTWTGGTTLFLTNWSGVIEGGGIDQLYIGTNPSGVTSAQLSQIKFVDPFGFAPGVYAAQILASGEIVPVPEPSVLLVAFALLAWALWRERRARAAAIPPSVT